MNVKGKANDDASGENFLKYFVLNYSLKGVVCI